MKKYYLILCIFLVSVLLISCDSTGTKGEHLTIGVVFPNETVWNQSLEEIKKVAEARGYTLIIHQSNDPLLENEAVQSMLQDNIDALIVAANDGKSELTQQWPAQAGSKGIPLLCYDRLIKNTEGIDFYISFDPEKTGELQGRYIADHTSQETPFYSSRDRTPTLWRQFLHRERFLFLQPLFDSATGYCSAGRSTK